MIVKIEKGKYYIESPEKAKGMYSKRDPQQNKIVILVAGGLYNLCIANRWVVENKKTMRSINKWLESHGYETRFEIEK